MSRSLVARLPRAMAGDTKGWIGGDLAIADGVQFGVLEHPSTAHLQQMKVVTFDEAEQGYSVVVKKSGRFIKCHQASIL